MRYYSFTCHPNVYLQMEWVILPQRITELWPILIFRSTEGRRLSWLGWLVTYRCGIPARRRSPTHAFVVISHHSLRTQIVLRPKVNFFQCKLFLSTTSCNFFQRPNLAQRSVWHTDTLNVGIVCYLSSTSAVIADRGETTCIEFCWSSGDIAGQIQLQHEVIPSLIIIWHFDPHSCIPQRSHHGWIC